VDIRIQVPEANAQKEALYFTHAMQKLYALEASLIFRFVWEFASAWRSISYCK